MHTHTAHAVNINSVSYLTMFSGARAAILSEHFEGVCENPPTVQHVQMLLYINQTQILSITRSVSVLMTDTSPHRVEVPILSPPVALYKIPVCSGGFSESFVFISVLDC